MSDKKVAIVTGANSGIGKATALALAKEDIHVILLCRNEQRGLKALEEISAESQGKVSLYFCDLADFDSVAEFTSDFKRAFSRLDILIHNAGVIAKKRTENASGIELQLAVHHLGPFLMNELLMPLLLKTSDSRIIIVTSMSYKYGKIDFDDLQMKKGYKPMKSYARSKLCNFLYMKELARQLGSTDTTINCVHPGFVATNIVSGEGKKLPRIPFINKIIKTPEQGAETSIYLATSPEVANVTNKYFINCKAKTISHKARNTATAKHLWDVSERLLVDYLSKGSS